ncbi:gliding motility protein GldB-related protein [Flavobacterium selenitireducens]|uniref:gliding motility protein GldB-related protein n=1 Tax=Flavobacterium selenitireducens TaxID=2722704 RepID=UPI00168AFEF0|nr:DUF2268 domain-containing putative Zn-dependent protease [Flavobacterium selenitireducens]MBD3583569.1 hypothetical protein [Flavobacterium selenitireducens]
MKNLIMWALMCTALSTAAQTKHFDTPFNWIGQAKQLATSDTIAAKAAIESAVKAGLFDVSAISAKSLSGIVKGDFGHRMASEISSNREKLQDPETLEISTGDIDRFWTVFDQGTKEAEDWFSRYVAQGSKGLRTFFDVRMRSSTSRLAEAVVAKKDFYASIRKPSLEIKALRPEFVKAAKKLEAIYPEAIFPPVYFFIGSLNNVGTPDGFAGMLIGTEHLCRTRETDLGPLSDFEKSIVFDKNLIVPIVVHEYVHMQQKNVPEATLLDFAIMEGAADFIAFLITGRHTNPEVFAYGSANEAEVWRKFNSQMDGDNLDEWLFNSKDERTGMPANMAYFVGFRICEAYYAKAPDKQLAVRELLEIQDFRKILKRSGYSGQTSR